MLEDGAPGHPHSGLQVRSDLRVYLLIPRHEVEATDFSVTDPAQYRDLWRKLHASVDEVEPLPQFNVGFIAPPQLGPVKTVDPLR